MIEFNVFPRWKWKNPETGEERSLVIWLSWMQKRYSLAIGQTAPHWTAHTIGCENNRIIKITITLTPGLEVIFLVHLQSFASNIFFR